MKNNISIISFTVLIVAIIGYILAIYQIHKTSNNMNLTIVFIVIVTGLCILMGLIFKETESE